MVKSDKEIKSNRIKTLFKKHKKIIGNKKTLVEFKEPILMLERRNTRVEFYENVRDTEFKFEHSDGSMRRIPLVDFRPKTFVNHAAPLNSN